MSIWYKQGVYGDLVPEAAEGLRLTERFYAKYRQDVYVTSIRDGTHMPGSFHPHGRAFDIRLGKVPLKSIRAELGDNFDVVDHGHRHIEYDPPASS